MELAKLKDFVLELDPKEKENLVLVFDAINEIEKNLKTEPSTYVHLVLREKYFFLIQSVIESNNELLVKLVLGALQHYLINESTCIICSVKEKSQFLLNILRFIQHTLINNDITKLEIFKFLLNNHEYIEPLLNSKILNSLIEISINESECDNKFLQSSSKALIIKYIAVVSNQISLIKNLSKNENFDEELKILDSFIVSTFNNLLEIFNQTHRSYELRNLLLECIELLLNNLIAEKQNFYDTRKNKEFIEFAWKTFCPSILYQFGDCGLPNNTPVTQSLNFKQIYTILIQLTNLIGGEKAMIPVFEAIYQRILFFTPQYDNQILLKLFKSYMNKDFLLSLILVNESNTFEDEFKNNLNEFTLINIFIGYYRNSYEQSIKANDKLLQFLSLECMHSYVKLIYDLFEENINMKQKSNCIDILSFHTNENNRPKMEFNDQTNLKIRESAYSFVDSIYAFLSNLPKVNELNLEFEIKKFSLNLIEISNLYELSFLKINSYKVLITSYLSIYLILKKFYTKILNLSNLTFNSDKNHQDFFIYRIFMYDECDFAQDDKLNESKIKFKFWLECVYEFILKESVNQLDKIKNLNTDDLSSLLKQIDCLTKLKISKKKSNLPNIKIELVKKLLKCSWSYLIDVLMGYLLNSKLDNLEAIFFNEKIESIYDSLIEDINNEVTINNFAFKSILDSLFQIIKILTYLDGMDKELNQLYFILSESNFYKNNSLLKSYDELSLNKIICLDFVLYTTTELIFNSEFHGHVSSEVLWKYLIQTVFFSFSLQANLEIPNIDMTKSPSSTLSKYFFSKKQKLFRSVYSNLNDNLNEPESLNRTKSFDLNEKLQLNEQILKNLFYFLNKSQFKINLKTNKMDLIDSLAKKAYDILFNKMSNFDHIWQLGSNLCLFSKRFLVDEPKFRIQNEYFSFNYLILDKLEDFLGKLMSKEISIFFTDLWLNVFLNYFQKIFSKCCSVNQIPLNQDLKKKSFFKLRKKISKKNDFESLFLVDFSICKKLIYLIQNLFEIYNNSGCGINFLEAEKFQKFLQEKKLDLVRTPSTDSSISTPIPTEHNFTEPDDLIRKLEIYKTNFNKNSSSLTLKLFYNNTSSLLVPRSHSNLRDYHSIDEIFNINSLLLLPFKRLMLKKSLETNLKDAILSAVCEVVERTSFRSKNFWAVIFFCLSRVTLNEIKKKKKIRKYSPRSLDDSFESSTSVHSDLSVYSSNSDLSNNSSSNESDRNDSFYIPTLPYRFESYRIRLNSLIDVFNIFLSISQSSNHILAYGSYDFLKCVSNYLQYKIAIQVDFKIPSELKCIKIVDSNDEEVNDKNKVSSDEEDLFLSANDYSIQERHYHFTSNYEHLCELSNADNSNTQIKPFILCIQKIFEILTQKRNDFKSDLKDSPSIQIRNFEILDLEKNPILEIDELSCYNLSSYTRKLIEINFDHEIELQNLNSKFKEFFKKDGKNYSKILVYFFKCLSSRVCLAQDEINSVQIVQILFDFSTKLVEINELETLGYIILEIFIQDLIFFIDLSELKNAKCELDSKVEAKFNPKLLENTFFMSSLTCKIVEKLISLVILYSEKVQDNSFWREILFSIAIKLFLLLAKCLIKKFTAFDSLLDINFVTNLDDLYVAFFKLNDSYLNEICLTSIRLFHALSLVPFETLIKNYGSEENSEFSNLEVLTQKCKTAWELHNVKKTFSLAKSLLNYENFQKSHQSINDLVDVIQGIDDESLLEDDEKIDSNDDKNFFRDFSLKFSQNLNSKTSQIFHECIDFKQVNLTCFINAFKFHSNFLNLLNFVSLMPNLDHSPVFMYEILKCLSLSYLTSIQLEQNLALKILLSKIFYLNYETYLASFINLTKKSFFLINSLYFKKRIMDFNFKLNDLNNSEIFNYNSLEDYDDTSDSKLKILIANSPKDNFFKDFFFNFVIQLSDFYKFLNSKVHSIKLDLCYLDDIFRKYQNHDFSIHTEKSLALEVNELFEKFTERNKLVEKEDKEESYSDRNLRHMYKIWTLEMIPYFLINLSEPISEENKDLNLVKIVNFFNDDSNLSKMELIKSLAELIVVFNSCSTCCSCRGYIENEATFLNLDFNTIKNISIKLLSILFILSNK
ncbi:unnamed protein product [Brachionus calyciflorus]|uniref:Uncharacterized protein n=1 Tax=Brachionus calyciflorus TaxID=104777 RepID=A0A813RRY7_9BILA|nr:unnamed protein product [Brachionus calyciflorus]